MPIKLPAIRHLTEEDHRRMRYEQYREITLGLDKSIRQLCANHRAAYEEELYQKDQNRLNVFISERKPNQIAEEYYKEKYGISDTKGRHDPVYQQIMAEVNEAVAFICLLTDHPKPIRPYQDNYENYIEWVSSTNRPDFQVLKSNDAARILRNRAKATADRIVEAFVYKVTDKLLDILVDNQDYKSDLIHGVLHGGGFEGDIRLTFKGYGVRFRIHLDLKTNYSVYGKPYLQYPLTFHDFDANLGEKPVSSMSQDEVMRAMGVTPWKPPKTKKPWQVAAVGDIVELQDGCIVMVMATRAPVLKFYRPGKEVWTGGAEDIKFVHARTKSRSGFREPSYLWIEMFNGRTSRFEVGITRRDLSSAAEDAEIRRLGFLMALDSWDKLQIPQEPKQKKRTRWR